ncbi:MAG TPA: glycosyltransferase family 9 protein, partial [Chloroflexia bacterium]|nr:glycosyltransferase family 9 protein [Chloroflexia bacterium]
GEPLIGLHPGGEGLWGRKRWPVGNFVRVADGLDRLAGAHIMIMGGKDDIPLARQIEQRTKASVINAAGQTTLGETAALASMCSLFIGNDSSPLHIAAASGTPVIGIYGPTDPRSYHPWVPRHNGEGPRYEVVRSHLACACRFTLVGGITVVTWITCLICPSLRTITPRQVLAAAERLLSADQATGPQFLSRTRIRDQVKNIEIVC